MKAKRIVSILLTGSMLLSLLPVSALAATPVFDAPAQTTAKKAAPLVQEADASRSTEEEAATRSSRDLDAENGTADSFTIQLNADGTPAGYGDGEHWYYSAASGCQLDTGVFALQPSSEPGAESALKARLFRIGDNAELVRGTVGCETNNYGTISGGTFQGSVYNSKDISGGTFQKPVNNYGGTISGGTFEKRMTLMNDGASITISDGLFKGEVVTEGCSSPLSISGGLFTKAVDASKIIPTGLSITGGYFVSEPTLPNGSDIAFTTVSDQNGRTFQVRVNGGFSKNGYEALYVPHGMSERQANPITVKTDTALTDCLADGVSIMGTDKVQLNDDGSYTIEVYQPTSIVLVTEKPAPSTPDEPGDELDPGFSSGAAALGIVLGTAGLGYITYAHISSLYLYYTLPGGFIPSTRQELANVLWTTAGKPDPVSTALYTDIPADAIEQQKAARWCVEQGLLSDYGATFGPDTKVTNARIIRAWNSLKKVPVPITN
ncbi:MAG: hypothetical protein U0I36_02020 [Faecalibacterium prausnitzii]|nr:hypothetical protein [Faecalibacterium prausnitzii]